MQKRPDTALHSSWNWELISDKPLDWWIPKIEGIKKAYPDRMLIASIMAGSGSDKELAHWQDLAKGCQDAGADAFELNLSCPHMDRKDMGSNLGKDQEQVSIVTEVVKEVAKVPVWSQAHAVDHRDCRRSRRGVPRRRRCDRVVEHLPVAAADRSGDARLRDERRRAGVERRARRPGDPAAVARQDVAADQGVSRQGVLRHRRHQHLRARAQLHAARLRHGAGLHRGDARSRDRARR